MSDRKIPPLMWAFTVVLALGTGVGGYVIGANSVQPAPVVEEQAATNDLARRVEGDPMALGDINAPVVISEFSDWDCPFCVKANVETLPRIVQEYVESGQVRLEWNDFVVNGQPALEAARAGRAAADQGKFFEYQEAFMAEAGKIQGHPGFVLEDFVRFAEAAGVPDIAQFKADAQSDKYDAALQEANMRAQQAGFNSTPTFMVGTQEVVGAQPYEVFVEAIESQL